MLSSGPGVDLVGILIRQTVDLLVPLHLEVGLPRPLVIIECAVGLRVEFSFATLQHVHFSHRSS